MTDFTTPADFALPDWLTATFEEPLCAEWMWLARACMKEIEAKFAAKHPDRIEVCFAEGRGRLNIFALTNPPLVWFELSKLNAVTNKYQTIGNDAKSLLDQITRTSSPVVDEAQALALDIEGESTEAQPFGSSNQHEHPPILDLDENVEGESADMDCGPRQSFRVFSGLTDENLDAPGSVRDEDTTKRLSATMRRLTSRGPMRPMQYPRLDWQSRLDALELDFPNFSSVIRTIIRPHLGLLSHGHRHRMVPTLLVGEPGVGKTQFARELQAILGVPALFLVMAQETNGSALGGSSVFWSNAAPGKLFEQVAWGHGGDPVANPLIIIDEVDKAKELQYDPLAALYSLLEVETAARFEDQAVPGVLLDLSHVRFLLTANDASEIPSPLLSRVRTFHIQQPGEEQMKRIAQKMFESLVQKYNLDLKPELPTAVLDDILQIGPRETKVRLDAAIAIAVTDNKHELDLVSWKKTEDRSKNVRRRIGFF